jgi:hypothetical protein
VEWVLDEDRLVSSLSADHGRGIVKKKVRLVIDGFDTGETLPKRATKRQRVEKVIELVGGDRQPWTDDQKIDLLADAMNIPPAERDRAVNIWNGVKEWEKKYGGFRGKVEDLRHEIDTAFNPKPSEEEEAQARMEHIARGGRPDKYRGLGSSRSGVARGGITDEDSELSEYGKEVLAHMGEYRVMLQDGVDRDGKPIYRAETNTEYWERRKREGTIPDNFGKEFGGRMGRSEELHKLAGGRKYSELSDEEKPKVAEG